MKKEFDYLIVGAGLYGSTFARLLTDRGKKCLVIDKHLHTGGNIYCEKIEGINVHKYGAHIFHTSDKEVWGFVNRFVSFNRDTNCPVAIAKDGEMYNLPFNMNTFYKMWGIKTPTEVEAKLEEQRQEVLSKMKSEGISTPRNLEEQALMLVGRDIYEFLVKEYTEKQWGRKCIDLPPSIIRRLPVRFTFDNNYFNDDFQGIPIGGYNKLIEGLLKGVEVRLGIDFLNERNELKELAHFIIYTGAIDAYFEHIYGNLEWRTVHFDTEVINIPNFQGNAVINYTSNQHPFTRIIEHKHFESFGEKVYSNSKTVISREYSIEWHPGMDPYYPVNDDDNNKLYNKYYELSLGEQNVIFGGRLAEYKYYDMAPIIKNILMRIDTI